MSCPARRLEAAIGSLLLAALLAPAALAEDFNPLGDGSGTNNADLLRDPTTGCENCTIAPPAEWSKPPFDLEWSLALRGAYVHTPGGDYIEGVAAPSVTLRHEFLRGAYEVNASAEIVRSTVEDFRIGSLAAGIAGTYQLDEVTALAGAADFALARDSAVELPGPPSVLRKPLTFSGGVSGSVERDFGAFVVTGRADASRAMYEPTILAGPVVVDNSHQNNWLVGGGLRVGYRLTPILTAFVDGSVAYQLYDAPSPDFLVRLDAADLEGRVGLSGDWGDVWEAEAAIGYGVRRFAAPALGEASAVLADASITFRPDETLELRGAFTTGFDAPGPDTGGTARLEYVATGDVAYVVNPWLTLRASAAWYHARLVGTPDTEQGYAAGVGADYLLNEHTTLSADYAFAHDEATPDPAEDVHRVTLGVTFSR